jgi:ammonium transporter Rh
MFVGASQHRIVINTILSISCSVVAAFAISKAIFNGKKFDMEHIQNATIAGGVAIGAVCNMLLNPWGAMLTGTVAGIVCTYGFTFFTPRLKDELIAPVNCDLP